MSGSKLLTKCWWTGSFLPSGKVVAAGSTPATSGGVGGGAWVGRSDDALRDELNKSILSEAMSGLYGLTNFVTPEEYGAIGDGYSHPLSERFSTLVYAQVVYPFVTSLTQSLDYAGIQAAANAGKQVYLRRVNYILTDGLDLADSASLCGHSVGPLS